jgi:predicted DNA-binding transcriptional regulator AlpA
MSAEELGAFPFGGGKQLYILSAEALTAFADRVARQTVIEHERRIKEASDEPYISLKEACELLKVCRASLWRWEKQGYLTPQRIGGKTMYKRTDIEKLYGKKKER